MSPEQFKAWRKALGLSQGEAAALLDLSPGSVGNYERGVRREDSRPVEIPFTVAVACIALLYAEGDPRLKDLITATQFESRKSAALDKWLGV
jgi:transcriptional regulator with XRE-family HTH domain